MRPTLDILFWVAAFICVYAYVGYGAVITLLARLRPRPVRSDDRYTPTVSLIICAYNEEQVIEEKLANSFALDYPAEKLEIIVVSDGSNDRTAEIVAASGPDPTAPPSLRALSFAGGTLAPIAGLDGLNPFAVDVPAARQGATLGVGSR